MFLLGLIICAFGFSFSNLLLVGYGGSKLGDGLGTQLLRGQFKFQTRYDLFKIIVLTI
jgi:hypothetical protein